MGQPAGSNELNNSLTWNKASSFFFVFFLDSCTDMYDTDKCERWKDNGDCIVNKKWMDKHCRLTCKACKNSDSSSESEVYK